jgi:hypothetical protein
VLRIAVGSPTISAELRRHPGLRAYAYTERPGRWQINWYAPGNNGPQLALAYVSDTSARVTEAWTGFQIAWSMARGYPGAFARHAAAWYVWLPLCLLFVAPFLPRSGRPTLVTLDVLVLVLFSVSLAFFNHARIGLSVPLAYPCLLYLLGRMLVLAAGRGRPRGPLRPLVPPTVLLVALLGLIGFRVALNLADSGVIDVGYSGVIGADRILHGQHLYGGWALDDPQGGTYGPVNYLAYVPFRAVFGWSGHWDDLPAAHGAALAFDLLWWGVVYGAVDALILTVLPVVATWRAATARGWTDGWTGHILVGVAALAASVLVTTAYHLGFAEYRGSGLGGPLIGNTVMTLGTILAGNPLTAVIAHIAMHIAAVLHGAAGTTQLPPHY